MVRSLADRTFQLRLGCVAQEACFVPILKSFLAPVDDEPDLGAFLREKSDDLNPVLSVPLNESYKVRGEGICKFCKFLAGSFSAVSERKFARKYACDSIFQALQDLHTSAPLQSQHFTRDRI